MPGAEKGSTVGGLAHSSRSSAAARASAAIRPALAGLTAVVAAAAVLAGEPAAARAVTAPAAHAVNLLGNPGAQTGAVSMHGWDSVTIPGWRIVRGLPTVVRYGDTGFPGISGRFPATRGGQMFSGGLGGTAVLSQQVSLAGQGGHPPRPGARYRFSGWLGGTRTSRASVTVRFLSASGRLLALRTIGPVGAAGGRPRRLVLRAAAGLIPRRAAVARVTVRLGTSLPGADGPNGALVGYNRAVADGLRLQVSSGGQPGRVRAPVAHVPRYQHVFLFYLENQDFRSLIGNRKQAPFLNSLLPSSSLLERMFAEEHPSDANYLALAGGSAFGVPLTDPLEINPLYTIRARSIATLLDGAHESWKGYLQSANGPCDDTVHGTYWNDDLPLLYFAGIRNRPAYCARHVVPLEALPEDLASARTTPRLAWIGSNDCSDMEGCGIHAGDIFVARELRAIMRSPAWRDQRSLAIITVDEDNYDHPNPPQRVATLLLASSGVRHGYVSRARYTHYSLLRTIEAALGLPTLTANDRYAQPVNDVFRRGAGPAVAPPRRRDPARAAGSHVPARRAGPAARRRAPRRAPRRPPRTGPPLSSTRDLARSPLSTCAPGTRARRSGSARSPPRSWPLPAAARSTSRTAAPAP